MFVRALFAVLLAVTALTVAAPAEACACGIALEAQVARERALVVDGDGREDIIVSLDLAADPGGRAAVVFPVPADPEVGAVEGGDPLDYLDTATAPRAAASDDEDGATAGAAPGGGVDVIGREEVGGYDVTRLRADDPSALNDWLDENGYELPDGATPILKTYVQQKWRYVAIRLAPEAEGRLKPLRISFAAEELVYPMRLTQLGDESVDLTLYVLADGAGGVDGAYVPYSGSVDDLSPRPPEGLADLFAEGNHVTRLSIGGAPSTFTSDLVITVGAATTVPKQDDDGFPWWGWALIAFGVVDTVVVGLVLRNRRRAQN